jgi:hypothetical protein
MRLPPALIILCLAPSTFAEPIRLLDSTSAGREYSVTTDAKIGGELQAPVAKDKPPETIKISGKSRIDYIERILPVDSKEADHKSLRVYERIEFNKKTADRTDESTIRSAVRRLVVMKRRHAKVSFSPDGPLTWAEIDLIRTDILAAALVGLLPEKEVELNTSWRASPAAVDELTGMEKVDRGELTCTLEKIEEIGQRRIARVAIAGTLEGVNEDGPTRQKLSGYLVVDLLKECVTYLKIDGEHYLLDEKKKEVGKVVGSFEMTRTPLEGHKALADDVIKELQLEPSEENTRLLFDSEQSGVRFVYSRNWNVGRNTGRQITLDERSGAGLLITLDTAEAVPTPEKFLREAMKDLADRGAKLTNRTGPERLADGIDRFVLDGEMGKEAVTMAYFVIVQEKGGATLAARLPLANREARMKELERLARSFTVTRRSDGK